MKKILILVIIMLLVCTSCKNITKNDDSKDNNDDNINDNINNGNNNIGGGSNNGALCNHSYKEITIKGDCENPGYTLHKCDCGDTYTSNYVSEKYNGHNTELVETINDPCLKKPVRIYKCKDCDYVNKSYEGYSSAYQHQFENNACVNCRAEKDENGLIFKLDESSNEYTLVCVDNISEAIIPSTYKGLPVTKIGDACFYCDYLTKIVIPSSVKYIGDDAFYTDGSDSYHAYNWKLYYDGTLEDWCNITFENYSSNPYCRDYPTIYFKEGNEYKEPSNDLVIPEGVKVIKKYCFYDWKIETLKMPNTVEIIEEYAFCNCRYLVEVEFSTSLISVGACAFCETESIRSLTFPDSLVSIGVAAFAECESLSSIYIGKNFEYFAFESFAYNEILDTITVSSESTKLKVVENVIYSKDGKTLVFYPTGLFEREFIIPSDVEHIGAYAFNGNENLEKIVFNDNIKSIGTCAFYGVNLGNFVIPSSLTTLAPNAFEGCYGMDKVFVPNSIANIGAEAFDYGVVIYCEASSKPSGWDNEWNYTGWMTYYCETHWGATEEDFKNN